MQVMKVLDRVIGQDDPTYFIADIAANHDGSLSRAKDLVKRCADAGADAAKFQNFFAKSIVSDLGFKQLSLKSHQSNWNQSVYDVYDKASISLEWTHELYQTCSESGIHYLTSPYDMSILDELDKFVCAWKVGSGDITWHDIIRDLAQRKKPLFIATGASTLDEVNLAMSIATSYTDDVCLMQCNTNYTGSLENFKYVNLSVLSSYRKIYPKIILGLSDHTPGDVTVLGAIALGAKVIEKHFTDDQNRDGPDHKFSMSPAEWRRMVDNSRLMEASIGDGVKRIEDNEKETTILQRRSICASIDLEAGTSIDRRNIYFVRPCPPLSYAPYQFDEINGKILRKTVKKGQPFVRDDFEKS